ncbi:AAA family ATPase [Rhizobium sp. SG741]|uniref:AAA family ATPase n=1 Tax=Rhizobium sp. SG741 TaxID=2587114 RepID=UPI00144517C5|nr:AAA family ATPase [Rhizobium sp. SG741]NKJ05423.1 energy-coupling factor transporter ATP-binding protein EcfA2 [Rhizobium sp. SG741]
MSIEIFANNYRGFKDISLNLDKNLFLVGDNSSGKSSILYLIGYIYGTELMGIPRLDLKHMSGGYDFFSPYFDHADVTIGFLSRERKTVGARVVTIKRNLDGETPKVSKMTTIYGDTRLTILKKSTGSVWFKFSSIEGELTTAHVRALHGETSKFKRVPIDDEEDYSEDHVNLLRMPWSILRAAEVEDEQTNSVMRGLSQNFLPGVVHSGPVRGLPERYYNFERKSKASGSHFASMLHDLEKDNDNESLETVRRFGRDSQLFEDLNVARLSAKFAHSPLVVTVRKRGRDFLLDQVGVGISQVIPVIIESVFTKSTQQTASMLLQQPELHLHPVAQAALGEFLFRMATGDLKYVVETHSDFLIDRFRANMRETPGVTGANILFCENKEDGNHCHVINISDTGEIENPPENYKDFFVNELMRTMF